MLSMSDLKVGTLYVDQGDPYEVLEAQHVMLGRGMGHMDAKVRNLRTGNVLARKFKQADKFEEADVSLRTVQFVFTGKQQATFRDPKKPSDRIQIEEDRILEKLKYLAEGQTTQLILFGDDVLGVKLLPKVDLLVTEAPPWIKGDTAQGGTKEVTVSTGLRVKVPPFIEEGDTIRVNTERGDYVERVSKA